MFLRDPRLHFVGLTPSDQLVDWLVDMPLSDQILIGWAAAGVPFIRRTTLPNSLFSGVGGTCVDLMCFIF